MRLSQLDGSRRDKILRAIACILDALADRIEFGPPGSLYTIGSRVPTFGERWRDAMGVEPLSAEAILRDREIAKRDRKEAEYLRTRDKV